jgi:hypothetical protein
MQSRRNDRIDCALVRLEQDLGSSDFSGRHLAFREQGKQLFTFVVS